MNVKILIIVNAMLVSILYINQAYAVTSNHMTVNSNADTLGDEIRLSGVVAKMSQESLEINAVTYKFNRKQAKVYDLNGKINPTLKLKTGMFVNFLVVKEGNAQRIAELRFIRM
jgi:hypothetical protein